MSINKSVNSHFKYAVLGSGSSANAYIFQMNKFSFILDNGFSCREVLSRAEQLDFNPEYLNFIMLTHTHADHLRGVEVLSRKLKIPVVMHKYLNTDKCFKGKIYERFDVIPGKKYSLGDLTFIPFDTSHDAEKPLGYHFRFGGKIFTHITDTGKVTEQMLDYAAISDILFLEANYCTEMLERGPYPAYLKKRIRSDKGHLSNSDAISFLNKLNERDGSNPGIIYFCHLSEVNNSPEKLENDIKKYLKLKKPYIICKKGEIKSGIL